MLTAKQGRDRTTGSGRTCCVITLAWLAFGWVNPAFAADAPVPAEPPAPAAQIADPGADPLADSQPVEAVTFLGTAATTPAAPVDKPGRSLRIAPIATRFWGDIGYDIEQQSSSGASPRLRQRVLLNLRSQARSYISQPWIAKVTGGLGFTASKAKSGEGGSSNNTIVGNAGLYLLPYSRMPFEATVARNQEYTGPGIGSPVSQTTRFDILQSYKPRAGKERYQIGYNRSLTAIHGVNSHLQSGMNANMQSNRFDHQSINVNGTRQNGLYLLDGRSTMSNQASVEHRYRPSTEFSVDSLASLLSLSDDTTLSSSSSRTRELNSTLNWQPLRERYSVLGAARVNVSDFGLQQASSQSRSANANLSGNYRATQHINLSASGNINVSEYNSVWNRSVTTTQTATASYPLAALNLDAWRYNSRIYGSVANRTNSNTNSSGSSSSVQSISVSPGHSLGRGASLYGGRLNMKLDQLVALSQTSNGQAAANLNHSASADWQRTRGTSISSVTLNGRDSRSLISTQNTIQLINLSANIRENISRNETLSGSLSAQATRQVNNSPASGNVSTNSSASLHYNNLRAFNTPRLIFDSDLRTYSRAIVPVLVATPAEQGPISWENTLSYVVGRLSTEFKVNLSKDSDGGTQSLISLSLKRYF